MAFNPVEQKGRYRKGPKRVDTYMREMTADILTQRAFTGPWRGQGTEGAKGVNPP